MYVPVLAQACGPCQISAGGQCVTCPDGSDLPECVGCEGGELVDEGGWIERHDVVPSIIIGVATAAAISLFSYYVLKEKA